VSDGERVLLAGAFTFTTLFGVQLWFWWRYLRGR
jgi:hypothetical protein